MTPLRTRCSQGAAPDAAREIRRRVFVEEQGVDRREEWDAHDEAGAETLHFVAWRGDRALGCARLRALGGAAKIERVAVLREHRDHGLGRSLMQAAETAAWRRGHSRLAIHAQLAVLPFYERLGWRAVGPEFVEANVVHRKLEKTEPVAPAGEGWRRLRADWQRTLVDELAALPGVEAVVLGGSHARGHAHAGSDIDVGLVYRDARPLDISAVRALAARWSDAADPVVSELYEWGPWVNGGAWLTLRGRRVDLLYRSLDRLERTIGEANAGRHEIHFGQQPPFGFWSGTLLGECACALPLHDPSGHVERLRRQVAAYPEPLRRAVLRDMQQGVAFGLAAFAEKFAARGDTWGTVSCLARCVWQLGLALFALNHCYLVNDKTLLDEVDGFALAPEAFRGRVERVLSAPGRTPTELSASVEAIAALSIESAALLRGSPLVPS
jgi:predicted GNAT family N-acyltransferase/predicted nucleotidyltransferase